MTEADFQLCVDCENPEELFRSNEWAAEEKLDGDRRKVVKCGGVVTAYTRAGNIAHQHPADAELFSAHNGDFVIDGEQFAGRFHLFAVESGEAPEGIARVARAEGEIAKRALAAAVSASGGEGIVFKRIGAGYSAGRNDDWQRLKNYETDTFVVTGHPTFGSIEIERNGVSWGRCPVPVMKQPPIGARVRIRYDRATANGRLLRAKFAGVE